MKDINLYIVFFLFPFIVYAVIYFFKKTLLNKDLQKVVIKNSHGKKDIYYLNDENSEIFNRDIKKAIDFEIKTYTFFKNLVSNYPSINISFDSVFDFILEKDDKKIYVEVKLFTSPKQFKFLIKSIKDLEKENIVFLITDLPLDDDVKSSITSIKSNVVFLDQKFLRNTREVNVLKNMILNYFNV